MKTTETTPNPPRSPQVLVNTGDLGAVGGRADGPSVAWKLEAPHRDLDSNVIELSPGGRIDSHRGPDHDVLIHVLAGTGTLDCRDSAENTTENPFHIELRAGDVLWMPRRSQRQFTAGPEGLRYLTVHQKRQALQIQRRRPD